MAKKNSRCRQLHLFEYPKNPYKRYGIFCRKKSSDDDALRIRSIYDIDCKPISRFEQECYSRYSPKQVRVAVFNMYNTVKNIPGFTDKIWGETDTIFDVVEYLYDFITSQELYLDFNFSDDFTILEFSKGCEYNGTFSGIFIEWVYRLKDGELHELCKDTLYCLINKCDYPVDPQIDMNIEMLMNKILDCEQELEDNDDFRQKDEIEFDIKMTQQSIDDYTCIKDTLENLAWNFADENTLLNRFISIKARYERDNLELAPIEFLEHLLILLDSNINFKELKIYSGEGYSCDANIAIYWSDRDQYWEEFTNDFDEIANNNGINDYVTPVMITKDSFFECVQPDIAETLIKLSHISRTKIYDTKFILNKEED